MFCAANYFPGSNTYPPTLIVEEFIHGECLYPRFCPDEQEENACYGRAFVARRPNTNRYRAINLESNTTSPQTFSDTHTAEVWAMENWQR